MLKKPDVSISLNENCFTLIRYLAAFEVIIGHCVEHFDLDKTSIAYHIFEYTLGMFPGVPIFFGLSGFLIWASLDKNDDVKQYAKKRILRIYPELWIAVVFSLLSIIILYKEKIDYSQFGLFCLTQATFLQFWTPDCLRGFGCGTPNGSLWTICTFVQFYILAWLMKKVFSKHKKISSENASIRATVFGGVFLLSLIFSVGYSTLDGSMPEIIYKLLGQTIFPYLILFMIGILIYEYRQRLLPVFVRYWYIPLVLFYVVRIFKIDIPGTYIKPLSGTLMLITVFALGYRFKRISIKRDYSYGLYLYHMIIVNIIIHTGVLSGIWASISVIIISSIVSVLSGELVKRIINKKQVNYEKSNARFRDSTRSDKDVSARK